MHIRLILHKLCCTALTSKKSAAISKKPKKLPLSIGTSSVSSFTRGYNLVRFLDSSFQLILKDCKAESYSLFLAVSKSPTYQRFHIAFPGEVEHGFRDTVFVSLIFRRGWWCDVFIHLLQDRVREIWVLLEVLLLYIFSSSACNITIRTHGLTNSKVKHRDSTASRTSHKSSR